MAVQEEILEAVLVGSVAASSVIGLALVQELATVLVGVSESGTVAGMFGKRSRGIPSMALPSPPN